MENDFLLFSKEPEILSQINSDLILYSNKIQKMGSFLIKQERNFVVTPTAIYTFQNKKLKKKLKYEDIQGITFSTLSHEFIIHRKKEYDFHYLCADKTKLICAIIKAYDEYMNKPITLCEIKEKSLKPYATTKKEKKKDENMSRMDESKIIDTQTFLIDNESNKNLIRSQTVLPSTSNNLQLRLNNTINDKNVINEVNNINIIFNKEGSSDNFDENDYKYINIITKGKISKFFLVKNIENKKYYVMKTINKNCLKEYNKIKIEKILKNLNHDFLVNIILCYETFERIYFFSEYIQNEDLFYHIHFCKNKNENINENKIRFFAASIIIALEYLHKIGIVYRDLTPRNILINKDGYIKITPFSFEQIFTMKNNDNNKIKKNEYTSPEALNNKQNEFSDFWNLGEIIYEMIYGIPPFYSLESNNLNEIINKNKLKFPNNVEISENLKNLVEKLLEINFETRIGYFSDFEKIKNHDFFKGFNFDDLLNKKIESPYKPCFDDNLTSKTFQEIYNYEDLVKAELIDIDIS